MTTETVSRTLYDAMRMALKEIEGVLARHGCPQGASMTDWVDEQLTAARTQTDAQPVAWRYTDNRGSFLSSTPPSQFGEAQLSECEIKVEALYCRPVAPAAQAGLNDHRQALNELTAESERLGLYDMPSEAERMEVLRQRYEPGATPEEFKRHWAEFQEWSRKSEAAQQQAEPVGDEPPLSGRWHFGNGVVVCGTLRIFSEDFDTNPAEDFKEQLLQWVCDTLNAAQDSHRAAHSGQRVGVAEGWREFITGVAQQKPEKPDYWSSCGQCERNSSRAEDLLADAPMQQQERAQ